MTPQIMVITGTRKGIGRYLAEYYASRGFVVEGCSREAPDWSLENYTHHRVDVTSEKDVNNMMSSILRRHGRLDVAINNAGIAAMNHTLLTSTSAAQKIMATNFLGTFHVCRASARLMKIHNFGRIVNLSTIAVPLRLEGEAVYAASKSAITTFTQVFASEVAEFGVTCNVVGPTPIDTDLIRNVPQDKMHALLNRLGIKRMGTQEDVANVVDFFIRPESANITGQVIYLGGV